MLGSGVASVGGVEAAVIIENWDASQPPESVSSSTSAAEAAKSNVFLHSSCRAPESGVFLHSSGQSTLIRFSLYSTLPKVAGYLIISHVFFFLQFD
jgi:hypothetical protein